MENCPQCAKSFEECQCATRLVPGVMSPAAHVDPLTKHDPTGVISTAIPGYKQIKLLGRGASSAVFLAEKLSLFKTVAIKLLYQTHHADSSALKRFELEARALSSLSHPNVVDVFDIGIADDGTPYIIMEFVDGIDLKTLLTDSGAVDPERAIGIFCQLCDALSYAHGHGIIHRDLKPGNVIIVRDWKDDDLVKLVDFGIAKPTTEGGEIQRLTQTGEMLGSPGYMSPEQIRTAEIDQRSDIYALGCIMYEMLTGRPPFRGESIINTLNLHLEDVAKTPETVNPKLEQWGGVSKVVMQCLAKERENRPSSALEVKQALEQVLKAAQPKSHNRLLIYALVAIAVLLAVNAYLLLRENSTELMPEKTTTVSNQPVPLIVPAKTPATAKAEQHEILELARGQVYWYTSLQKDTNTTYNSLLKKSIERGDPVETQLAIGLFAIDSESGVEAKMRVYKLVKPHIDDVIKRESPDLESLFASYILWELGYEESSEAQDLRKKNRAKSDQLAQSCKAHLEASLFLAKCRNDEDARGVIAHVSKDLGSIYGFQRNFKAARDIYKRSFDAFRNLSGLDADDTVAVVKLLGRSSLALYETERVRLNEIATYLKTSKAAVDAVVKEVNDEDAELITLQKDLTRAVGH